MIGQLTLSKTKFFVHLLCFVLYLSLFITLAESNMSQKQSIMNAVNAQFSLKNSERGQSDLDAKDSGKITATNKSITNKKISIQGTVDEEISQVVLFSSNNADIYRDNTRNGSYEVQLSFATPGTKEVHIVGLDENKEVIDELIQEIDIKQVEKHLIHNVPYFYQYHNDYFPASTCQNTAIAILLKYYG
ncbi:MAG: hypothetical protein R6V17_03040, partial [Halanaerobacter sp.]